MSAFFIGMLNAEGVSIETMQKDPYFSNGNVEKELEKQKQGEVQEDMDAEPDPESLDPNSKNFYNAKNWSLGIEEPEETEEVLDPEQYVATPGTDQPKPRENITFAKYSDQLKAEEPWFYRHADFTAGYSAFYGISTDSEKSIPVLFDLGRFFYIAPVGINLKAETIVFKVKELALTVGFMGEVSYLWRTEERYKLTAWQTDMTLFGGLRFHFIGNSCLEVFAGGGLMGLFGTKFSFVSGAESETMNFLRFQGEAGLLFSYYFTRVIGLDASLDFAFPLMFDEPLYPKIHLNVGLGLHI